MHNLGGYLGGFPCPGEAVFIVFNVFGVVKDEDIWALIHLESVYFRNIGTRAASFGNRLDFVSDTKLIYIRGDALY